MPTARPRHQVTETPAVARAIDRAALRWPGEPRSKLLLRLVEVGSTTLEEHEQIDVERHRAAVAASNGAYPEAFGSDYLAELREDWPA
ncbi:MAG: hypothetical protein M0007_01390 [Actinomycetota bacterium]|jgi:hypothetical protein|nr:hypothetical protein [Actinomycetota bacterium]